MSSARRACSSARLVERLTGATWITALDVVGSLDSTNDELRRRAAAGAPSGSVVLADTQTAGRGRLGRSWFSPPGAGLYLSALFRPSGPVSVLTRWTLAGAVAATEACRRAAGVAVTIKWPNDLLYEGRKLGGVLVELRSAGERASELIVGIGLNVSQQAHEFPRELEGQATSLALARADREPPERELLAAACLESLGELACRLESGDWPELQRRFEDLAPGSRGARVTVSRPGAPPLAGLTAGVAEDGALRVVCHGGALELVRLVDAVRPLEG